MTDHSIPRTVAGFEPRTLILAATALLALLGLVGIIGAAPGYALFLIATLLLASGLGLLAIFGLTHWFDTEALRRAWSVAFWAGAWAYVLAVGALSGHYVHEALAGRIDWKHMLFGPAILAAIVVLDVGLWRILVERNMPTARRFGDLWSREALDQPALRRTLVNEVILHRTLLTISPFRWARHQLIYWGFALMFMVEVVAVAFREAFPAFGWTDFWHDTGHPLRVAFDLVYEVTGLMILIGCIMALVFRARVDGTPEKKFTDTPTVIFLLIVVVTGFMVEGARFAGGGTDSGVSLVGHVFAPLMPSGEGAYDFLWILHALLVCAFIAYVPVRRLIHSCATPIGRMANSQTALMAAKKNRVVAGLARKPGTRIR